MAEEDENFNSRKRKLLVSSNDCVPPPPTVNFDDLSQTVWGGQLLYKTWSTADISDLVGVATSLNGQLRRGDECDGGGGNKSPALFRNNPLLQSSISSPPPPSTLHYILANAPISTDEKRNLNPHASTAVKALDLSGAVAMGATLEEMITSSLLPLAGLHVLRCRAIEDVQSGQQENHDYDQECQHAKDMRKEKMASQVKEDQEPSLLSIHMATIRDHHPVNEDFSNFSQERWVRHPITNELVKIDLRHVKWKDENVWEEWTLPPEEAIIKLLEQGMLPPTNRRDGSDENDKTKKSVSMEEEASLLGASSDSVFGMNASTLVNAHPEIFDLFKPSRKRG